MKQNILFVCKHNLFRSKTAEAYFKKINKNKNLKVSSAGFIKGKTSWQTPLGRETVRNQRKNLKGRGLNLSPKSQSLTMALLKKQDLIIIISNDLPNIFNEDYIKKNVEIRTWEIKDIIFKKDLETKLDGTIDSIIKKVDGLVKELK